MIVNATAQNVSKFSPDTVSTAALQLEIKEVKGLLACADTIFETLKVSSSNRGKSTTKHPTNLTGQRVRAQSTVGAQ